MKLEFKADMPDYPGVEWRDGGCVFFIHATPLTFGPYKDIEEAHKAFSEIKKTEQQKQ